MTELHYVTANGERNGRSSHFFRDITDADTVYETQNRKAEQMGIKTRYSVATCPADGIDSKEIR